jgi:hypothetical protein
MGYTTSFSGQFKLDKELTLKDYRWLEDINDDHSTIGQDHPDSYCQWVATEDGLAIEWDGGEKFYYYTEWLQWLVDNFFAPRGYVLNGQVEWDGEERGDVGRITVEDNRMTVTKGRIAYAGTGAPLSEELQERIDDIPGQEGFWKSDTKDTLQEQAQMLLGKGLTEDEVIEHLTTMHRAVSNEYGN